MPLAWDQNGIFTSFVAIEALKVLSCNGEGTVFFSDFAIVKSADTGVWFSFQRLLSSLFHLHLSFVHCSEHSKDGHCKDRLSFYDPLLLHWRYRSHLLDGWLYTKQGHLYTCFWPDWYRNTSNSIWRLDIWDDNVKASRHSGIVIDNVNLPT